MSGRGRSKYSPEQKLKACQLIEAGKVNTSEVAVTLGLNRTAVYRWVEIYKEKGRLGFFPEERKILISNEIMNNSDSMKKLEGLAEATVGFLEHIAAFLDADLFSRLFEIDKNMKEIIKILSEKKKEEEPEAVETEIEFEPEEETETAVSEISALIADEINGGGE